MKAFVRAVNEVIEAGQTLVLATVVESSGSTPRSSGAKMAVRVDGSIVGTVGGGLVEARAQRRAGDLLAQGAADGTAILAHVEMTQELAADSDMICGGGLSVLLEVVAPDGPCAEAYRMLDRLLRQGVTASLTTSLSGGEDLRASDHVIVTGPLESGVPSFEWEEGGAALTEPFIPPPPLYIFGAGHVSLFTARVAAMVGFRTVVLDDRADFASRERFPEADEVVVLDSFETGFDKLAIGEDAFIVIVTRGHLHDRTVLAGALRTPARYVGMIGSRSKRDKIYADLLNQGVAREEIARCHCPIGLAIGAQTPEEIAVAIAGELIQVRAGHTA